LQSQYLSGFAAIFEKKQYNSNISDILKPQKPKNPAQYIRYIESKNQHKAKGGLSYGRI